MKAKESKIVERIERARLDILDMGIIQKNTSLRLIAAELSSLIDRFIYETEREETIRITY